MDFMWTSKAINVDIDAMKAVTESGKTIKNDIEMSTAVKTDIEDLLKEKYTLVKGTMLEVIQSEVTNVLNFVCGTQILNKGDEHICVKSLVEDIRFCHVGLIQKYHIAYSMVKSDMGDDNLKDTFNKLIKKRLTAKGLTCEEAGMYAKVEVLKKLSETLESYSTTFEELREKLLVLHSEDKNKKVFGDAPVACVHWNFGILGI